MKERAPQQRALEKSYFLGGWDSLGSSKVNTLQVYK